MTNRTALCALVIAALTFAMLAAVGSSARAEEKTTARDYGVTEDNRRDGPPELMGGFVYRQRCAICHAVDDKGRTPYGPHLEGIVGRKAATTNWSGHSAALSGSALVWNEQALDKLLADPQKAAPGVTKNVVVRFKRTREALIAYLKTL